jgi:hypothetical protein
MICAACNTILSNFEATRKAYDGSFLDLCNECCRLSGVSLAICREDLAGEADDYETEDDVDGLDGTVGVAVF